MLQVSILSSDGRSMMGPCRQSDAYLASARSLVLFLSKLVISSNMHFALSAVH